MSKVNNYKYTHELINKDGEQQKFKTYCVFDSAVSRTIMLKMFKSLRSFKSSLYPDLHEVSRYEQGGIYKEPKFSRNLQRAYFEPIDHNSKTISASNIDFRLIGRESTLIELKDKRNILDNSFLTFNEALFILLGFYCILAPKYQITDSDDPVDIAMLNTKQAQALIGEFATAQIPTEDFLEWAKLNGFIKEKTTNKLEAEKKERVEIVKEVLITYLKDRRDGSTISIHALSKNSKFHNLLAKKGLMIIENIEDKTSDNCFTASTLGEYLTKIVTSSEWIEQPIKIQDRLTHKPSNKPKPKK